MELLARGLHGTCNCSIGGVCWEVPERRDMELSPEKLGSKLPGCDLAVALRPTRIVPRR